MLYLGQLSVKAAQTNNAIGFMDQPSKFASDDYTTLAGATLSDKSGVMLEPNTMSLIRAPRARMSDMDVAAFTTSGGSWRSCTHRPTGKKALLQYDASDDVSYAAETTTASLLTADNQSFVVDLSFGACPAGGSHTAADCYRQVMWPSDAASGENCYRVTLAYGEANAKLELSTDGRVSWTQIGTIPAAVRMDDPTKEAMIPLTVMHLPTGEMVLWLGPDLARVSFSCIGSWLSGKLKVSGKNGAFKVAFSNLYFAQSGHYISVTHEGPADMTGTPKFYVNWTQGDPSDTIAGAKETVDAGAFTFTYRLTLTGVALSAPNADCSLQTDVVKQVNVDWPCQHTAPPVATWTDINGILGWREQWSWDANTKLFQNATDVLADNSSAAWMAAVGQQAIEVYTGYEHDATSVGVLRARLIANIDGEFDTQGPLATYRFTNSDLLYVLTDQFLSKALYPAHWCVYTVVRHLLEYGQIVPELMEQIPCCTKGLNPEFLYDPTVSISDDPVGSPNVLAGTPCPHTKFGAHAGWREGTPVLTALAECQFVENASMGQNPAGQFLFQRFDPDAAFSVKKTFSEAGTSGNYDEILDHSGGLRRIRSLRGVKNVWVKAGYDPDLEQVFVASDSDASSLSDHTAFNYVGYKKPSVHIWTGYDNATFANAVLAREKKWARLPEERIVVPCWGQPNLFPLDVIQVVERRTTGSLSGIYFLTDVISWFEPPSTYLSLLYGAWVGPATGYGPPGSS